MRRLQRYQKRRSLGCSARCGTSLRSGLMAKRDSKEDDRQPEPRQVQPGGACEEADEGEDDGDPDGDQRRP